MITPLLPILYHIVHIKVVLTTITCPQKRKAVDKIKTLKIKAIHHKDLEYQLISESQPKYNKAGVEVDYTI